MLPPRPLVNRSHHPLFRAIGENDHVAVVVDLNATGLDSNPRWKNMKNSMQAEYYAVASRYGRDSETHMERIDCQTKSAAHRIKSGNSMARGMTSESIRKLQPKVTTKGTVVTFHIPGWKSTMGLVSLNSVLSRAAFLELDKLHAILFDLRSENLSRRGGACSRLIHLPVVPDRQAEVCELLYANLKMDDQTAGWAADALGVWGTKHSTVMLAEKLKSANQHIRMRCITALSKIGDPSAIPILVQRLADRSDRYAARRALEQFGAQTEPALLPVIKSPDDQTRDAAIYLLGKIGGQRSIAALKKLSSQPRARFPAERAIREIERRLK